MMKRPRSKRSISGFTLLEMLVVIIVIAVLFAIAAPGWDAIWSRQQISAAREQVLQSVRLAQSEARRSRAPRIVMFDQNAGGKARIATAPYVPNTAIAGYAAGSNNWEVLGNGNIPSGRLRLTTNSPNNAIVFDGNGTVAIKPTVQASQFTPLPAPSTDSAFVVTLANAKVTGSGTNRCVIINTLLGGTRVEDGPLVSSTGRGCP